MNTPPNFNHLLSIPPDSWPPDITIHYCDTIPGSSNISFALILHNNTKYFLTRRYRPNGSCYFHTEPTTHP